MQTLKKGDPNKTVEAKKIQDENNLKESLEYINKIDIRLAKTFYAIEADSYAYSMIWRDYRDKFDFVQDYSGFAREIGRINNRPVMLTFNWWIVNNNPVLFYCCNSELVDWKMIENWFEKYMPHLKYKSDSQNACNVLNYCTK